MQSLVDLVLAKRSIDAGRRAQLLVVGQLVRAAERRLAAAQPDGACLAHLRRAARDVRGVVGVDAQSTDLRRAGRNWPQVKYRVGKVLQRMNRLVV